MRDVAGEPGSELSTEGVGGQNCLAGAHNALWAVDFHAVLHTFDGEHTRLLEDLRARTFRGAGKPARESKRMEMSAAVVESCSAIDLRTDPLRRFLRAQHARIAVAIILLQMFRFFLES